MTSDLDLHGLALALHRSKDWAQRNWREMVRRHGLPAPFVGGGPGQRPWWNAAAVEAWKRGERGGHPSVTLAQPTFPAANDALRPRPPDDDADGLLSIFGR